ncbi:MAG: FkbM family methyltransferase [Pseudomonadota bacterium]
MILKTRKLIKLLAGARMRDGLRDGVAAAIEHSPILRQRPYVSIFDVGGNKGQFALAARHWQPSAEIYSFEPLTFEADRFERVFDKDEHVTLHRYALGSAAGEATIHVSARSDSSSLLPISDLQSHFFPGTQEADTQTIQVRRLDEVLQREDCDSRVLLKIDVQGFELEVLRGAEGLLSEIDDIYVECSFVELYEGQALASDVIDFLSGKGYRLTGMYNPSYDKSGLAIQADFAFERVHA